MRATKLVLTVKHLKYKERLIQLQLPTLRYIPKSVIAAETTNCFKNRLDKFWKNQEMIFNYKEELTGIGNRSNIK